MKEVFYAILTTERRRDAMDAQIRAAELRIVETRNAVDTGVALEMKAAEVRAQIAQAKHALGQLQDAVADMKLELADLCGLPLDTELELARPGRLRSRPIAGNRSGRGDWLSRIIPRSRLRPSDRKGARGGERGSGRVHSRDRSVCAVHPPERRSFPFAEQRRSRATHEVDGVRVRQTSRAGLGTAGGGCAGRRESRTSAEIGFRSTWKKRFAS